MSDWTEEEYSRLQGTKELPLLVPTTATQNLMVDSDVADSIDWVQAGKVGAIKNQGTCKSCYAFAAAATVESSHAIATGELLSLSAQ
jgi:C1A family cysteine protease